MNKAIQEFRDMECKLYRGRDVFVCISSPQDTLFFFFTLEEASCLVYFFCRFHHETKHRERLWLMGSLGRYQNIDLMVKV